jgi:hypothetical protein
MLNKHYFIAATGFAAEVTQESITNIMKDGHMQAIYFGEKMPKKKDWKLLRSWADQRLEKLENYMANLENLNELLIKLCIAEEQERQSKRQQRLALPAAQSLPPAESK